MVEAQRCRRTADECTRMAKSAVAAQTREGYDVQQRRGAFSQSFLKGLRLSRCLTMPRKSKPRYDRAGRDGYIKAAGTPGATQASRGAGSRAGLVLVHAQPASDLWWALYHSL